MMTRRRQSSCHQRGFVLLVTLLLLALAAVVLLQLSVASGDRAAETVRASAALQHRWAVTSIRTAFLHHAGQILEQAEQQAGRPVAKLQTIVLLGGERFQLTLYDEQAKLNVNTLYGQLGEDRATRDIQRCLADASDPPAVLLQPVDTAQDGGLPLFGAWEQVFDHPTPAALFVGPDQAPLPIDALTCWSDGTLNARRASPQAIAALAGDLLSTPQIQQLIDDLAQSDKLTLADEWRTMKLTEQQQKQLATRLTDKSTAFGLLLCSGDDFKTWYEWDVLQTAAAKAGRPSAAGAAQGPGDADFTKAVRMVWQ